MFTVNSPEVRREIEKLASGTTRNRISKGNLASVELPISPLAEQCRIVSKLESLRNRSQRAKEALDAIPALLERFRQSVLAAAFRGDLTADWRAKHADVEPASKLLERIRSERRRHWEEAELESMRVKRKTPRDGIWRTKYEIPDAAAAEDLPELPPNWCWASLGESTEFVTSGSRGWADFYSDTGPIFLRVGNLDRYTIDMDLSELSHVMPPEGAEGTRTAAVHGDILISITADVGMVGIVPDGLGDAYVNQHIALCRPLPMLNVRALAYALTDPKGLQKIVREIQYGATKASLSLNQVRSLPVPLPPLAEQAVIASRLDSALAIVQQIEKQASVLLARQQDLNESLLAKAFRGELVPQDPDDEPASVLLERIRAERESTTISAPKRPRGRRPAA
jgi:type I restriction enzyme S subunit